MKLRHFIIPSAENDHSPHLLQKTAFFLLCGLAMVSFAMTNIQSLVWQSSDWLVGTVLPAVVIDKTNDARAKLDEEPLRRSAVLDEAARLKAEDMAKNNYFAHHSPSGVSPWHWFDEVGYVYAYAGENLAVHFTDSKAVVEAWLNSPTHRANIANAQYQEIGVGTALGEYEGFETVFVVQLFGTPAAPIQPLRSLPLPVPPVVAAISEEIVAVDLLPEAAEEEVLGDESVVAVVESESFPGLESEVVVESTQAIPVGNETVPTEVVARNDSHSLFIATSSPLTPVTAGTVRQQLLHESDISFPEALATTPNTVLRYIYLSLGMLVSILLVLSVALAARYHRPWQIAYGIALLMLMTGLFYLQSYLTSAVVLADTSL
jgi:hypothetical protein